MSVVYDVAYSKGEWVIELRPRNTVHEGEPTMKVWVIRKGQEVAQFSTKYRGYGYYRDHEELLPEDIDNMAKQIWEKLYEAPYSPELLEEIKGMFAE